MHTIAKYVQYMQNHLSIRAKKQSIFKKPKKAEVIIIDLSINFCAFASPLLNLFQRCPLAENMRYHNCDEFFNFLKSCAHGYHIPLPETCFVTSIAELVGHTFGNRIDLDELQRLNNRKILIDDSRLNVDTILKECVASEGFAAIQLYSSIPLARYQVRHTTALEFMLRGVHLIEKRCMSPSLAQKVSII